MVLRQSREFDAIKVGRCHVRSAKDRYGVFYTISADDDANQVDIDFGEEEVVDSGISDSDTDDSQDLTGAEQPQDQSLEPPEFDPNFRPELPLDAGRRPILPAMASNRMNLTALSQRYNLYFVAYRGEIYTYRPRDAVRNTLPSRPDYVLKPKAVGPNFNGHIHHIGHQVNNMVVGDMGEEEVLALVYDNGNVIAYNVRVIASHITALERDPRSWAGRTPRPFLHQSVGISAWGLALHKKSRLLAVSCNSKVVTVFYPGLENAGGGSDDYLNLDTDLPCSTSDYGAATSDDRPSRRLNRRKIFRIPLGAANLPAVTFSSRPDGTADKVACIDLSGRTWVFDVWGDEKPIQELPYNNIRPAEPDFTRGWGIMFLPASSFLPVLERKTAYGAKFDKEIESLENQSFLGWDISSTKNNILDSMLVLPSEGGGITDDDSGDETEDVPPVALLPLLPAPTSPLTYRLGPSQKRRRSRVPSWPSTQVSEHDNEYSVFKIGLQVMELHSLQPDGDGVAASGMLEPHFHSTHPDVRTFWANMDRPNKLLHIPELSLIVVGSLWGYVLLVRLTEVARDGQRGFRVEWALPRQSDVTKNKSFARLAPFGGMRDLWYLHGIAVSPVPESRPQAHLSCRRFRLLLHYRNHSIVSYEISQDPGTDELLVV